jgi:hypothetical protein
MAVLSMGFVGGFLFGFVFLEEEDRARLSA